MASKTHLTDAETESKAEISTFAVLDLETSNLPAYNNNRVSITELCIYAFDPSVLRDNPEPDEDPKHLDEEGEELWPPPTNALPSPPRVLHKLNLLFQPAMAVHPEAERITGLNNYILERESKLDENAGQIVLRFLEHLRPPVCLIAHNGWHFDFPIVKQAFEKLNLKLPSSLLCVDSLRAFLEIDDKRARQTDVEYGLPPILKKEQELLCQSNSNWQAVNETTPKRPKLTSVSAARKRKHLNDDDENEDKDEDEDATTPCSVGKRTTRGLRARRQLFTGLKCAQNKRVPPRGLYNLAHLFERTFHQSAVAAHQAEADVHMLTKLVQHYGVDFVAFAEEQAIPFAEVVKLGAKSPK